MLLAVDAAHAADKRAKSMDGQAIYKSTCSACHGTNLVGAPMLGDKKAWAPIIAQGQNVIIAHATKGIRGMPPKGGNPALTAAEIKAAVEFMVARGK